LPEHVNSQLRAIPAVQTIQRAIGDRLPVARVWLDQAIRDELEHIRQAVLQGEPVPPFERILTAVETRARRYAVPHLRPVLNATGVMIHTNLGRSPLPPALMDHVAAVATQYSTLEYRLSEGQRGSRHEHVEELLTRLVGTEAAMVVNNNAAAVLLALSTLAEGREVVVSRGELVEIGGSFRVPEVMALSGARLREVGATNKTHLRDYTAAIQDNTALLLKVHQSNFRMMGFVASVELSDLVQLGRQTGIPVMADLGSGVLRPLRIGDYEEPDVTTVVQTGVDVTTFSGDKLLGGPQAGIVVGRRDIIQRMKKHPLARAVRVDKMTLAALEMVLRWYAEGRGHELPLWQMIEASPESIRQRAETFMDHLRPHLPAEVRIELEEAWSEIGGGSMPGTRLPTYLVTLAGSEARDVVEWERRLRESDPPVIVRVSHGKILVDLRTIFPQQEFTLQTAIVRAITGEVEGGAR